MSPKTLIMIGMTIGSLVGGYLPVIFGADIFSLWSLIGNTIGGILGIYITYKIVGV